MLYINVYIDSATTIVIRTESRRRHKRIHALKYPKLPVFIDIVSL